MISIVSPAYNERANLPSVYERLVAVMDAVGTPWEWILVDDHSTDGTYPYLSELAQRDSRVKVIRLARNHNSMLAIACGLQHAEGDCAVVIATDGQDPPELIPQLLDGWREGYQVVWMARRRREGEKLSTLFFSRLYHSMMRHVVGVDMPSRGADFWLLDRRVVDALSCFNELNFSIMALTTWVGFRQKFLTYDKQARLSGTSNWSYARRVKLALDSITAFTYLPMRVMSAVGLLIAALGFLYAAFVIVHAVIGHPVEGWSSLMVVVLVVGGIQMLMMGMLGEYVWRALDEARRRPRFLIESSLNLATEAAPTTGVRPRRSPAPSLDTEAMLGEKPAAHASGR